ncbi:vacuolar membrane-associated protein iml1 [Physocladia obscura]|uniref:Vacuolar membrane-associated protein IML1 n=1 Tax=Physocladia obscura TaxID=109957 RepID=A0AAD5TBA3_9FUNG|nr:vacuolar membrane-associated protein iml1 [Physocladia obscura]
MECILWVHDERFSSEDLVVSAEALLPIVGVIGIGDLLEIEAVQPAGANTNTNINSNATANNANANANLLSANLNTPSPTPLIVQVTSFVTEASIRNGFRERVSVAQHLAAQYKLQPHMQVTVRRADRDALRAELVVLAFANQYVTRSDMWRLKLSLRNKLVYAGKRADSLAIRSFVAEMVVDGKYVECAYITDSTKLVFRSHTAKIFIFIQMSKEMWEFGDDGQLFSEKCINGFLPDLFSVWKEANTNHIVSIVLCSRILYKEQSNDTDVNNESSGSFKKKLSSSREMLSGLRRDYLGRPYRDFYRVVLDWETRSDWLQVLVPLKREFVRFEKDVLQNEISGSILSGGYNSSACDGNFLEAVNLAMNPFVKHYVDRDLVRTGLAIIVVTPSPGLFNVDKKLLRLTTQRMFDNGVACDIVSLTNRPLYMVPLFQYIGQKVRIRSEIKSDIGTSGSQASGVSGMNSGLTSHASGVVASSADDNSSLKGTNLAEEIKDPLWIDDDSGPRTTENGWTRFFNLPNWCDVSFYNETENENIDINTNYSFRIRAKLPEAHSVSNNLIPYAMVDFLEQEIMKSEMKIPLDDNDATTTTAVTATKTAVSAINAEITINSFYDQYDQQVFLPLDVLSNQDPFEMPQIFSNTTQFVGSYSSNIADSISYISSEQSGLSFQQKTSFLGFDKNARRSSLLSQRSGNSSAMSYKNSLPIPSYLIEPPSTSDSLEVNNPISHDFFEKITISSAAVQNETSPITQATGIKIASNIANARHNHQRNGVDNLIAGGSVERLAVSFKTGSDIIDYVAIAKSSPGKRSGSVKNMALKKKTPNPCNSMKSKDEFGPALNKWEHLFPSSEVKQTNVGVNWKSMSTPACLPISHGFYPSEKALGTYDNYIYSVTPDDTSPYQESETVVTATQRLESLLIELISQRLSQGFQIITAPITEKEPVVVLSDDSSVTDSVGQGAVSKFWKQPEPVLATTGSRSFSISRKAGIGNINMKNPKYSFQTNTFVSEKDAMRVPLDKPYYLGFGDHIHRLHFDLAGQNVTVRKLTKDLKYIKDNYNYKCMIWAKNLPSYLEADVSFAYPHLSSYSWNTLDHLIGGSGKDMTDGLRFWRARFLLIPLESITSIQNPFFDDFNINEEDLRLIGFDRFIDSVEKSRWYGDEKSSGAAAVPTGGGSGTSKRTLLRGSSGFGIQKTTFSKSQYVKDEWKRSEQKARKDGWQDVSTKQVSAKIFLTKSTSKMSIVSAMYNPVLGLEIKDRSWHKKVYYDSFIGSEFVDWMLRNFSDLHSRDDAVAFGNELHFRGIIVHGNRQHQFLDGFFFFKVSDDCRASMTREVDLLEGKEKEKKVKERGREREREKVNVREWGTEKGEDNHKKREKDKKMSTGTEVGSIEAKNLIPPIELSKRIVIDLDPQGRSSRKEMAILHYDTLHNSHNCYHLNLHWLACTPRLIEELLEKWHFSAKKNGFKFVEAPIEQARRFSNDKPLQSTIQIDLSFTPPSSALLADKTEFIFSVARKNGFILDLEAGSSFEDTGASVQYSYSQPYYEYTQFVHRTGAAFIQALPDTKGFLWSNNYLYLTNDKGFGGGSLSSQVDILRHSFSDACANSMDLQKLWNNLK